MDLALGGLGENTQRYACLSLCKGKPNVSLVVGESNVSLGYPCPDGDFASGQVCPEKGFSVFTRLKRWSGYDFLASFVYPVSVGKIPSLEVVVENTPCHDESLVGELPVAVPQAVPAGDLLQDNMLDSVDVVHSDFGVKNNIQVGDMVEMLNCGLSNGLEMGFYKHVSDWNALQVGRNVCHVEGKELFPALQGPPPLWNWLLT